MTKDGESTIQKVKDVLHIGGHKDTTHTGTTHNTSTTGTHVPGTTHTGHAEGSHGPHSSAAANAADPRVDSDLDGNRLPNKTSAGYGTQDAAYGTTGTHTGSHVPGTTHTGTTHNTTTGTHVPGTTHTGHAEGSHGPHNSAALNAVDPRVDSDLDGNRLPNKTSAGYGTQDAYGTTGAHTGTTGTHIPGTSHTGTTHTGTTGTHIPGTTNHQAYGHAEGSHGPHNSAALNAVDPRVDSDLDGNRLPNKTSAGYGTQDAYGTGVAGTTGAHHHQGTTTGSTGLGGVSGSYATPGSGQAPNTAGPHNSDLLNKADPRVDADLDGSKTFGGNKTYQ